MVSFQNTLGDLFDRRGQARVVVIAPSLEAISRFIERVTGENGEIGKIGTIKH